MSLRSLVDLYLLDCRARGLSEATITRDYGYVLGLLADVLGDVDLAELDTEMLRDYIIRLRSRDKYQNGNHPWMEQRQGEHLSKWSVAGHVKTIKTFFNWAHAERLLDSNPGALLKNPRKPNGRIEIYSDAETLALLDAAAQMSHRDYTILLLLLDTGLRRSELCALRVMDVNITGGTLEVHHGKGDKYRSVMFGSTCQKALWTYANRHRDATPGTDAFFVSQGGGPLTSAALGMLFKRLDEKVNFRVFAHKCRHTWATNLARQGRSEYEIMQLGGWNDTTTPRLYIHLAERDVITASPMDQVLHGKRT
jgi:site-specific recombinase XerD